MVISHVLSVWTLVSAQERRGIFTREVGDGSAFVNPVGTLRWTIRL